jgi:hypothetical protein
LIVLKEEYYYKVCFIISNCQFCFVFNVPFRFVCFEQEKFLRGTRR